MLWNQRIFECFNYIQITILRTLKKNTFTGFHKWSDCHKFYSQFLCTDVTTIMTYVHWAGPLKNSSVNSKYTSSLLTSNLAPRKKSPSSSWDPHRQRITFHSDTISQVDAIMVEMRKINLRNISTNSIWICCLSYDTAFLWQNLEVSFSEPRMSFLRYFY